MVLVVILSTRVSPASGCNTQQLVGLVMNTACTSICNTPATAVQHHAGHPFNALADDAYAAAAAAACPSPMPMLCPTTCWLSFLTPWLLWCGRSSSRCDFGAPWVQLRLGYGVRQTSLIGVVAKAAFTLRIVSVES